MQIIINGLINGLCISVFALGFSVIYYSTNVFALSLAGIYVLTPYLVWQLMGWGIPLLLSVAMALLITAVINIGIEKYNHCSLVQKGASLSVHMISSLAIYIILTQIIVLIWGNNAESLREGAHFTWELNGIILTQSQIIAGGGAVAILAFFYAGLRLTKTGLKLRALSDNPVQLALYGVNIHNTRLLAASLAAILAGLSSIFISYDIGFDPYSGLHSLLLAVVASVIGGRSSFLSPMIGGILIGLLRAEVGWFFDAQWQDAATFLLLVLILFFRPLGLMASKRRIEQSS